MDNVNTEQVQDQPKEKVIGQFKPKEKFLEFVGGRGNIQFHADEALIEAKHLSGLDMDGITLKLTICDEGTVNFDEVDTNKTTVEQRERLLDVISEKTISMFNNNMVVTELPFKSVQKIKDKEISLYLAVEYQTPISKLASIFDDDEDTIEVSDEQNSKLSDLLSMFDEGEQSLAETLLSSENGEEINREFEGESDEEIKSDAQKAMEESFAKMKEEKLNELKNRLDQQTQELKRYQYEKVQAEGKIETAKTDIRVLESRIDSLQPPTEPNGYYFFVSEQLNEKIVLDEATAKLIYDKVSKLKSINADAFMKLFEAGEYQIRIGAKSIDVLAEITDYNSLPDDIKLSLQKIGTSLDNEKLVYNGDLKWHDIVDKMIKYGFSQDPEFDKMCGSNSYFAMYGSDEEKLINKLEEVTEEKFKSLVEFGTPTDIVILGDYQDVGTKFEITDDETSFEIHQNDKKIVRYLSSTGFGSVMTLKEYQKLQEEKGDEMTEWEIVGGVLIPNFSGTIGIAAVIYNQTNTAIYNTKFDLSDYIQHQVRGGCDVVINIPGGFNIIKLNDDLSLPVEVLRDIKIDDVIK
jgi:hypothetical protein